MENTSTPRRWLAFLGGVMLFWAFIYVICPAINRTFPAMGRIAQIVDEYNLRTGMFFYTDVEVSADAAMETSSTIRFTPHGANRAHERE